MGNRHIPQDLRGLKSLDSTISSVTHARGGNSSLALAPGRWEDRAGEPGFPHGEPLAIVAWTSEHSSPVRRDRRGLTVFWEGLSPKVAPASVTPAVPTLLLSSCYLKVPYPHVCQDISSVMGLRPGG